MPLTAAGRFTLGSANADLAGKFHIYWAPAGQEYYNMYMMVDGWGPCGAAPSATHTMTVTVAAADDRFTPAVSEEWNPDRYVLMDLLNVEAALASAAPFMDTVSYDAHHEDPEDRAGYVWAVFIPFFTT